LRSAGAPYLADTIISWLPGTCIAATNRPGSVGSLVAMYCSLAWASCLARAAACTEDLEALPSSAADATPAMPSVAASIVPTAIRRTRIAAVSFCVCAALTR
jgi:hypothetical protein